MTPAQPGIMATTRTYGALSSFDLGEEIDAYVPANSGRLWGVTGRLVGVRHTLEGDERVTRVTVELGDGQVVKFAASSDSHLDGGND